MHIRRNTALLAVGGTLAALALWATVGQAEPRPAKASGHLETVRGFVIHTAESAPEPAKEVLQWYVKNFQFVPNLAGVMAESPALMRSYWQLQVNLQTLGTLSPPEDNVVQMTMAMENKCQYCVAGHHMAGKVFFGSTEEQLQAIRAKSELPEAKFNALRDFALAVANSKGRVTDTQLQAFLDAGYTRAQALDVVGNLAAKVMSNFANQLALTPLDEQTKAFAEGLPFKEDRRVVRK